MYNDIRLLTPTNAPAEKPAARGFNRGRGRGRARGRARGRVTPIMNEVPNNHAPRNGNPPAHEEVILEDEDVDNVEEVEQEEGGQDEAIGITTVVRC